MIRTLKKIQIYRFSIKFERSLFVYIRNSKGGYAYVQQVPCSAFENAHFKRFNVKENGLSRLSFVDAP